MHLGADLGNNAPTDAKAILESITDGFFFLNLDWEFAYVNSQSERILGREKDDLLGKTIWSVYPGLIGSQLEAVYRAAMRDQIASSTTEFYPDHDRWYEAHAYPAAIGLSVYFRNVTERIRIEKNLQESENRFRSMADAIPQLVWIADGTGHVVFFNKQWRSYTGVQINEMESDPVISTFIHPDDQARTAQSWSRAQKEGTIFAMEHRIRSESGHYRWFLTRAEPEQATGNGDIIRWYGTSTDVDDHKVAEMTLKNERDQSQHIFDSMSEGFAIMREDWQMVQINAVGLRVGQRTRDEVMGRTVWDAWPEILGTEIEMRYRRVMSNREPETFEQFVSFSNGVNLWLELRLLPVLSGGIAVHYRDITERNNAEQQLMQADRRKDEFLAMLAHELRNPLAPISAAAELLRMAPMNETRVRQTSEIISRQVKHMTSLVDDLLDVSRVTRGSVVLEKSELDAKHIVADAIEQVRPLMEARRHDFAVHLPPETAYILGDHKRMVQVLTNLLNNAAKYTPEGGEIALGMEVTGDQVILRISDNGIGMSREMTERAFELFAQAERTADRTQGGLGIGLALVKSLCELHGGTVSVRSSGDGAGSEFLVCLPRVRRFIPNVIAEQDTSPRPASQGLHILIVDDNVDAGNMLAMFLEAIGHHVIVEHDARAALERARLECPDVCLLDIGLPEMDGNELAQRLRALSETTKSVLIAVTGYSQEIDRERSIAAGFDHHLVKPVDTKKLVAILNLIK